jgi:glycerophosphoryl diester phosphodiesterase
MFTYQTKIFAHRGFSAVAPENTIAAFELAICAGADGVELDVHMTKDKELVVIHDETVNRTTNGLGWVKEWSLAEIKKLDNGTWFSDEYKNQTIPTLSQVLEVVKDTEHWINIELKNNMVVYSKIEELVVREIERFGMEDRVILSSFNHCSLHQLHLYRPKLNLGVLFECGLFQPWIYAKHLGVSSIHPFHLLVTDEMIQRCRIHGIHVCPFTVDDEQGMKRLIASGVDAIITNFPDRLRLLLS